MRYAIRNILRLRGKSLLTLMLSCCILSLCMLGITVRLLCEDNRKRFYGPLDGSVHVTSDSFLPYLTYDAAVTMCKDAEIITAISAVKEYIGYFHDTKYIGYDTLTRESFSQELPIKADGEEYTPQEKTAHYCKSLSVMGVTSMDILEEVYSGALTVTEGTMISAENNEAGHNKIVISEKLALQNDLALGDTLVLNMPSLYRTEFDMGYDMNRKGSDIDSYTYIIGGIYRNALDDLTGAAVPWEVSANRVYVPISTLSDISESNRIRTLYSYVSRQTEGKHFDPYRAIDQNPTLIPDRLYFHLSDMNEISRLCKEINLLGFDENVLLTEYLSDAASSPSVRLSEIIAFIQIGMILVGFLIFMLVILFQMKARHRELAVLSALGKKRNSVATSFFIEILLLVCLSMCLSFIAVSSILCHFAEPATRYLYAAELSAKYKDETAEMVLLGDAVGNVISINMADAHFLLRHYALPTLGTTLIPLAILLIMIRCAIQLYVKRINALSGVGGKE